MSKYTIKYRGVFRLIATAVVGTIVFGFRKISFLRAVFVISTKSRFSFAYVLRELVITLITRCTIKCRPLIGDTFEIIVQESSLTLNLVFIITALKKKS